MSWEFKTEKVYEFVINNGEKFEIKKVNEPHKFTVGGSVLVVIICGNEPYEKAIVVFPEKLCPAIKCYKVIRDVEVFGSTIKIKERGRREVPVISVPIRC